MVGGQSLVGCLGQVFQKRLPSLGADADAPSVYCEVAVGALLSMLQRAANACVHRAEALAQGVKR